MTKGKITGIVAAVLMLTSASAFAQATGGTAPQAGVQAPMQAPAQAGSPAKTTKVSLQAREKSCAKEWDADKKAGKTKDMTYKSFIQKCVHEGA